ncbi:MAG: hypothetical protein OEM81_06480 [Acidimicrobiia bacterium]|nr:hypothetical protein [Acidimicrobiia bacterium]
MTTETGVPVAGQVQTADAIVERAYEYAEAVQTWGECVSAAARDHSSEALDPKEVCGDTPEPADHGLEIRSLPGKSSMTPGKTGATPGQSGATPGQSGATPGQSGE